MAGRPEAAGIKYVCPMSDGSDTAPTPTRSLPAAGAPRRYRIAAIPGDGVGQEVVPAAVAVVDRLGAAHGFTVDWQTHDWNCADYQRTGVLLPADGLDRLAGTDAILLGAVGFPGVPDHVSLWALLIPIRRHFRQYVNARPIRSFAGVSGPLRGAPEFDVLLVRENNEGEYTQIGGRAYPDTDDEVVVQSAVFTRRGTERIMRYAFARARERSGRLASATKSNGIVHSMPFWDSVGRTVAAEFPDVEYSEYHIDALAAQLVLTPDRFDVIVASNLFGDILSDIGAALMGGIGMAPSANLCPDRTGPSMFEPVHGSAPQIAGQGIANPAGQLLSAAMMLDHLGEPAAAGALDAAVTRVLADPALHTPDLGGTATTAAVCQAVVEQLAASPA